MDGADARVRAALTAADAEGIGGVAGVIEGNGTTTGLSASGAVTGTLPVSGEARGIGGIAGSLTVSGTAVKNLTSRAFVTGNRSAGGIAGYLAGSGQPIRQDLRDCTNEGLVLSSADADKTSLAGRYIGGIVGYAYHASLGGCTSRAGRAADYEYTQADRSRLRGRYVGGIVGYCDRSVLYRCSTGADGYVLGSEYVGGIVGGADEGANRLLLYDGTARVTANAACVIGNSYVGGIIGRNSGGSVIENCVNTGVAAGYQAYIGGICGANEKNASIVNCASYVSDTDGAVYRRVTGWGATGSYAGGLTGYNGGSIVFDKKSVVSTQSVAGIVVGRDYVGGLVGYNDADGTIDVDYTLIGGSVFASGDCAGGLAGLNASTALLGQTLTVKPASVQGRYYVGGAIGANVVNPDTDITVGGLRVDNSLGSVTAEAFCGGLIGYQRTYTEKDRADRALYALLPGIAENGDNVPGAVTASTNPHTVTITSDGNRADRLTTASNNMTIRAYAYAGGIVGCGEPQSKMQVVGCLNAGGFDRPADGVFPDSRLKTGVNLAAYLRTQGHEDAAQALSDEPGADELRVSIVGGIVGVNGENHVIDRCASRGTMNGLDAMGGVVGLNEGLIKDCTLSGSMGSATQDYIGGIAGLNVGGSTAGTIENCTAGKNCTVTGRTAVGGIAGENGGVIVLSGAKAGARRVTGSGSGVGGVIGVNTADGTLRAADDSAQGDVIAADNELTVRGGSKVGGIAGINRGTLGGSSALREKPRSGHGEHGRGGRHRRHQQRREHGRELLRRRQRRQQRRLCRRHRGRKPRPHSGLRGRQRRRGGNAHHAQPDGGGRGLCGQPQGRHGQRRGNRRPGHDLRQRLPARRARRRQQRHGRGRRGRAAAGIRRFRECFAGRRRGRHQPAGRHGPLCPRHLGFQGLFPLSVPRRRGRSELRALVRRHGGRQSGKLHLFGRDHRGKERRGELLRRHRRRQRRSAERKYGLRADADGGRRVHRDRHQLGLRQGAPVHAHRRHRRQERYVRHHRAVLHRQYQNRLDHGQERHGRRRDRL